MTKVIPGVNDLATVNPELAKEWHPTKNGDLKPTNVTVGSGKKIWWIGNCGHEWESKIVNRHVKHFGCPYCSGQRLLNGFNDLATTNPDLAMEWHPTKNGDITPNMVSHGSDKKVWWLGKCGHEWEASIYNRSKGVGCPYCSGQKVLKGFNDLATTNPDLAKEWDSDKNGSLRPDMITEFSSRTKVWWICKNGHEWQATAAHRHVAGCPICGNKRVEIGFNDLSTTNPEIAAEWHPIKNGNLSSCDVVGGSQKKVWWLGKCGHEWQASIYERCRGRGCPICSQEAQTSFAEQAIFYYMKCVYSDAKNRDVTLGRELDIYVPSIRIAVEYDGRWFHSDLEKDNAKNTWCRDNNIRLIRVREQDCPHMDDPNVITRLGTEDASLNNAIRTLFLMLNKNDVDINVSRDRNKILNAFIKSRKDTSFAVLKPELIEEWNFDKNGRLSPYMFAPQSGRKVWWKCSACGYEWETIISNRFKGVGCPKCARERIRKAACKSVLCVETGEIYESASLASQRNGIYLGGVSACCRGDQKTAGGYHWKYIDK